ncbi:hypothetical protein JXB12_00570 [candidate division KSB1 bacterium]|nr:hypothetical protein [candidate division KSB1 bacterium]
MSYLRSGTNRSWLLGMIAILAVVVGIMYIMNQGSQRIPGYPAILYEMNDDAVVHENKFYSRMFRCSIAFPDSSWLISFDNNLDTTMVSTESWLTLLKAVKLEVHDTTSIIYGELLKTETPVSAEQIAKMHLQKFDHNYGEKDYSLVRDVTMAGGMWLMGAYYVVQFSPSITESFPVRVSMFYVRNAFIYHLLCMADESSYEKHKVDFEYILKNVAFY